MTSIYAANDSLIKASDLIGLDIIAQKVGEKVNDVKDIIYDPVANRVVALVVSSGNLFSDAKFLLFEQIKSIGKDAVIVESEDVIMDSSSIPPNISHIASEDTYLDKTEVVTEDGNKLGKVTDIFFSKDNGQVRTLEVSGGFVDQAKSGKKEIPIEQVFTIGKDATIVSGQAEQLLEQQAQNQGLTGTINSAKAVATRQATTATQEAPGMMQKAQYQLREWGQTVQDRTTAAKNDPKTQDTVERVKDGLQNAKENIIEVFETGKDKVQEQQKKSALGQYLKVHILNERDEIIGKRGDIVTHELITRAEDEGLLQKVVNNVSQEPVSGDPEVMEKKTIG